jgi:uncharacterized damage-inducible protein DinB
MNAKDVLRNGVEACNMILRAYVDDLSDADLLVRAVPGSNHIAWQLGHMIAGTKGMIAALGLAAPELPEGFEQAHGRETAASDDRTCFRTKAEYVAQLERMKAAALAAIDATPDEKLDQPSPESMREYAPTVASVLQLLSLHWLMHAGQFVTIRRKLGKPALF